MTVEILNPGATYGLPPYEKSDPRYWGVVADAQRLTDASMSAASSTLTTVAPRFTPSDIGKKIGVRGADTGGRTLSTIIATYVSPTQITLASTAAVAVSGVFAVYGTDDTAAWQNALDTLSAAGGGTLRPRGYSINTTSLVPRNYVSVIGIGMDQCGFCPVGFTNLCAFKSPTGSVGNELTGATYSDFEIDGRGAKDPTAGYQVGTKGFFSQYVKRCHWRRLYIHDTAATGLGVDFLTGSCEIEGVITVNCGTAGAALGSAGIGIGTGAYQIEDFAIIGCAAINCAKWGIFVELQGGMSTLSRGMRIVGCYVNGGCFSAGICDRGVEGMDVSACTVHDVTGHGFQVSTNSGPLPINGRFVGGEIARCGGDGVHLETDLGPYLIDTDIHDCTGAGINVVPTGTLAKSIRLHGRVANNAGGGIIFGAGTTTTVSFAELRARVMDNGTTGTPKPGVQINCNLPNLRVQGSVITDTRAGAARSQSHGIQGVGTPALTGARIVDNDIANNLTADIALGTGDQTGVINVRNPT